MDGGHGVRHGIKRILETLTRKESTTTTTIREQSLGLAVDSEEATSVVSIGVDSSYPNTINAKFVKEQSEQQNVDGLKHALSASIEKSSSKEESGKLCKYCILSHGFCFVVQRKRIDHRAAADQGLWVVSI